MWIGAEADVLEGPQEETELEKWVGLAGVWQLQTWESTKRRRSIPSQVRRRERAKMISTKRGYTQESRMGESRSDVRGIRMLKLKTQEFAIF